MRRLMERLVAPILGRLGITPNMVTLVGLLLTVGVAAVLATGNLFLGGWLLIAAGLFDLFDGALARATNQSSRFGAFFDSIIDRYSEAVIFLGLLIHYQRADGPQTLTAISLVYCAIIGSVMVSYARARAEGLDFECETGWLGRPERITILCIGLILNWLIVALWVLAIFTNITAVQRIFHVWKAERTAKAAEQPKVRKPLWDFLRIEK
ncbi:MAG: CDP-alcohol phosphatidyltransferase family protein [Herpetosiphonaceae bacterium]|nr:CDP-alcohol phosphatidyltransferase family protein [Herpetosiphonaceae bacterium]